MGHNSTVALVYTGPHCIPQRAPALGVRSLPLLHLLQSRRDRCGRPGPWAEYVEASSRPHARYRLVSGQTNAVLLSRATYVPACLEMAQHVLPVRTQAKQHWDSLIDG